MNNEIKFREEIICSLLELKKTLIKHNHILKETEIRGFISGAEFGRNIKISPHWYEEIIKVVVKNDKYERE